MTFLHAKTVLAPGASGGIGQSLSTELLARGMKVVGIARSKEKLDQIAKEYGLHFIAMSLAIMRLKSFSFCY